MLLPMTRAISMGVLICAGLVPQSLEARAFKDKQGRTLEAEIIGKVLDSVTIKLPTGKEFTIALSTLSEEDQTFIKAWQPPAPLPGSAPVVAVTPGAIIPLSFPNLPKDLTGQPATCNLRIPDEYQPGMPVPLLVWLSGGTGGNQPTGGYVMVDKSKFAILALPYPSTAPAPREALGGGKMEAIYAYHQAMLAEVQRILPNIDPRIRIVAGFSNGAHTIGNAWPPMKKPTWTSSMPSSLLKAVHGRATPASLTATSSRI